MQTSDWMEIARALNQGKEVTKVRHHSIGSRMGEPLGYRVHKVNDGYRLEKASPKVKQPVPTGTKWVPVLTMKDNGDIVIHPGARVGSLKLLQLATGVNMED